jgi:DNA-binding ferritin-like protein
MKKKVMIILSALIGLTMILSSFAAHAAVSPVQTEEIETMGSTQYLESLRKEIADDRALLEAANDEDSRDILTAKISELESELKDISSIQ